MRQRVVIMGAAGRDFHNFNIHFRNHPSFRVVAITAAQIPAIEGRRYPPELAGSLYPEGIPIYAEDSLPELIRDRKVDLVVFSYSDVPHVEVMHRAAVANAAGADFMLMGAGRTMLRSKRRVVAVTAVRTGCGKSPTTRRVCRVLQEEGHKVVVVRHPMPYGDLRRQEVQRFAAYEDLERQGCTIEEREEYEPLLAQDLVVYAGVDYGRILREAEQEAQIIVWDGGNNDTPFFRPDLHLVVLDPLRAGHELLYYPGETNLRLADIAVIAKVNSASAEQVETVRRNVGALAPRATVVEAELEVSVEDPERIAGRRVLVVEDGPTLTHGGMASGAGLLAARQHGAAALVDPRSWAVGSLAETFRRYPHIGPVLPAMGYSPGQLAELQATIAGAECDLVLFATPITLTRLMDIAHPALRVTYAYRDHGEPTLTASLRRRMTDAEQGR
jgi:predicted GTPase